MANTALITGASAGIGKEFARYHASKNGDLILVARRTEALESLKTELESTHGIAVHVFAQDLSTPDAAQTLYDAVNTAGLTVDILINNAGFGGLGSHVERPVDDEMSMIDLNVKTLVALTHAFGRDMAKRGKGRILNVGSTAGFMPGPQQAVYFATKAFVNSFSQAVDHELRGKGVTCTVLAPGYVPTEFADVAGMDGIPLTEGKGTSAAKTAQIGYDAMMAGKLVVFNEFPLSFVLNWVLPFLPRRMAMNMVNKMQTRPS